MPLPSRSLKAHSSLRALSSLALLTLSACGFNQKVSVKDMAQQNVAMEAPGAPMLQGSPLKPEQTRVVGQYRYAADTDPKRAIGPGDDSLEGHSNVTHLAQVQIIRMLGDGETGWELGFSGGGALTMQGARVQNTSFSPDDLANASMPFLKLGVGLRGPILVKDKVRVGLNFEADITRQAYQANIRRVKTTETSLDSYNIFDPNAEPTTNTSTRISSELLEIEDHVVNLTPRAGLYSDITILPQLHAYAGLSAQFSKRYAGYAESECDYEINEGDLLMLNVSDQCSPKDRFPMGEYQTYLTFYGGLSLELDAFSVNLIASHTRALQLDEQAAVPFQLLGSGSISF